MSARRRTGPARDRAARTENRAAEPGGSPTGQCAPEGVTPGRSTSGPGGGERLMTAADAADAAVDGHPAVPGAPREVPGLAREVLVRAVPLSLQTFLA